MSRIGNAIISLPEGVAASIADGEVKVSGPKGELSISIPARLQVTQESGQLRVSRKSEEKAVKALHGTIRALLANMVTGVTEGWSRQLIIHGSGYRAAVNDQTLEMGLGYSHPVTLNIPEGLAVKVLKNTLTISGLDKQQVGAFAAKVRSQRKPEPYKGKGIRYSDEHIIRKVGKALKATA